MVRPHFKQTKENFENHAMRVGRYTLLCYHSFFKNINKFYFFPVSKQFIKSFKWLILSWWKPKTTVIVLALLHLKISLLKIDNSENGKTFKVEENWLTNINKDEESSEFLSREKVVQKFNALSVPWWEVMLGIEINKIFNNKPLTYIAVP